MLFHLCKSHCKLSCSAAQNLISILGSVWPVFSFAVPEILIYSATATAVAWQAEEEEEGTWEVVPANQNMWTMIPR